MTSDQRIALAVFAVALVIGGGIYLLVSGGSDKPQAPTPSETAATEQQAEAPPVKDEVDRAEAACGSAEIEGVPIREGQTPDARACEAMDFAVRFFQASPEQCAEFVSDELVPDCESRGELPAWEYVGDNGVDPAFPDVVCVEFAHADGFVTVEVEQSGGPQEIVGDEC